jgi:pimeloyl-ACP methyl ester carboxylesterase
MTSLFLPACAAASDIYRPEPAGEAKREAALFLHGYYGSALQGKENGKRYFVHIPTVLFGAFPIALKAEELGIGRHPEMQVEGLLSRVSFLSLYRNDIYGAFLGALAETKHVPAFAYDWREDLFLAVAALGREVDRLRAEGKTVSLLAHSMGGLVAAYYLAYGATPPEEAVLSWAGAEKVKRVAFFGTPFRGTMSAFRNMIWGTGYPWNQDLLPAHTVASFPSSYHLLPFGEARVRKQDGAEEEIPVHDPKFWRAHRLGLLGGKAAADQAGERLAYTSEQLARAYRFHQLLQIKAAPPQDFRVLQVVGTGRPTLAKAVAADGEFLFLPRQLKAKGLSLSALEEDGDGTITKASASLPPGLASCAKVVHTVYSHDKLFLDPKVEEEIRAFLR